MSSPRPSPQHTTRSQGAGAQVTPNKSPQSTRSQAGTQVTRGLGDASRHDVLSPADGVQQVNSSAQHNEDWSPSSVSEDQGNAVERRQGKTRKVL